MLVGIALAGTITGSLPVGDSRWWLIIGATCGVAVAHAATVYMAQRAAAASVSNVIDELRTRTFAALSTKDPRWVEENAPRWKVTLVEGLNEFRPYLSDYVPSLIAVALATPASLAVVFYFDWVSGIIALVTMPLIPAFMALIGLLTKERTQRRLDVTAALGARLGDLLKGSLTLRTQGQTVQPAQSLERTAHRHNQSTMSVLRLAFLSSFALEFLATLSVAVIAVNVGLRLVYGGMELLPALVVLIIAPEVFNPLRAVGTNFHAAANGKEAADAVFGLLDADSDEGNAGVESGEGVALVGDTEEVRVRELSISGRDGLRPHRLSFDAKPGQVTVLYGGNGSGKSTVLLALLGLLPQETWTGELHHPDWPMHLLPTTPLLVAGTVADNLTYFGAPLLACNSARSATGFDTPNEQMVGADGRGISAGQAQRLAWTRLLGALQRDCVKAGAGGSVESVGAGRSVGIKASSKRAIVLMDEPTAHLDPALVELFIATTRSLADQGHIVIVASHDVAVVAAADEVVTL